MDVNNSVWSHYPKSGVYLDPMYAPYARQLETTEHGLCPINTWKKQGEVGVIYPEHVRRGWGHKFQRKHSHYPCPHGYNDIGDGFCAPAVSESEAIFYTAKAFLPENQEWHGYAEPNKCNSEAYQFQNRSVNPFTGEYNIYFKGKGTSNDYARLPSRDSYLA